MPEYKQVSSSGSSVTIQGETLSFLVDNVIVYRRQKGLSPTGYNIVYNEVRNQLNRRGSAPKPTVNPKNRKERKLSLGDIFHGAKAYVDLGRGKTVSQQELNRRADICFNCPLISETTDCFGCGAGARLARKVASLKNEVGHTFNIPSGSTQTKSNIELSKLYCGVCGCSALALSLSKMKHIRTESNELNEQRPDNCWIKRSSINYKEEI